MLAELLYFVSIALFVFVVLASTRMPNDWLYVCILPVFLALILGFVMWMFAWGQLSILVCVGSLIVPVVVVVSIRNAPSPRNLFIAICSALVVGLICARFAFIEAGIG